MAFQCTWSHIFKCHRLEVIHWLLFAENNNFPMELILKSKIFIVPTMPPQNKLIQMVGKK